MKNNKNQLLEFGKSVERLALDVLFPISCLGCNRKNEIICEECFKRLETLSLQKCPLCEKNITRSGELCNNCKQSDYPLKKILVASDYKNKLLSRMAHFYKYKFVSSLAEPLGELLVKSLLKHKIETPDLIVPIPLHPLRLRWRGYNQANLLAEHIGENLLPNMKIPVETNAVKRTKYAPPQMKIKKYLVRQKNISGAFSANLNEKPALKGKKVLLVDDICTTGSTLTECARALQKLQPRSISAIVLARQS